MSSLRAIGGQTTGACRACGGSVAPSYRFCPWCATPQRSKLVEFFFPPAELEVDHGKALRVSRYLDQHHVRFSVWNEAGEAEAAVSIGDGETERLRRFLAFPAPPSLLSQLRLGARKTVGRLTRV